MQATITKHGQKSDPPGILVTLVTAPDNVGMRISDQGTAFTTLPSQRRLIYRARWRSREFANQLSI